MSRRVVYLICQWFEWHKRNILKKRHKREKGVEKYEMRPTVLLVLRLLLLLFCSPVIVFPPLASFTLVLIPRPRASTTIRFFATTTLVQGNVLNLGHKSVVADRRDDFARSVKEESEKINSKTILSQERGVPSHAEIQHIWTVHVILR